MYYFSKRFTESDVCCCFNAPLSMGRKEEEVHTMYSRDTLLLGISPPPPCIHAYSCPRLPPAARPHLAHLNVVSTARSREMTAAIHDVICGADKWNGPQFVSWPAASLPPGQFSFHFRNSLVGGRGSRGVPCAFLLQDVTVVTGASGGKQNNTIKTS